MGFWIFMFLCNLLIPITMLGFGKYFVNGGPKNISGAFGYRTSMSMKNKDTWQFAHKYCGRLWLKLGWLALLIAIISMMLVMGKDDDTVGYVGGIACLIQTLFLVIPTFPTERALKRNFDTDGHRKF